MNLPNKIKVIDEVSSKVKSITSLNGVNGELYVESSYFKDSFNVDNEPVSFYLVINDLDNLKMNELELKLNDISTYYLFNVVNSDTFSSFFESDSTKIS